MNPPTKLVILVSIHFLILFTAFNAFQTIVTKIHEQQGNKALGPFIFALNYTSFMITNLFVSNVRYSEKRQITLSTLTYVVNYLTGFFISDTAIQIKYIIAGFGAIVNGIGGSFLWTSIGSYIHKVCHIYEVQHMKGHYFGLFNTIFCISTVLGAIVVTFGLTLFAANIYFILVSGVAFLAFLYGIFFIKDIQKLQKQINKTNQIVQHKHSLFQLAKQSAISTLKYYPIMKHTLGLIVLDGIGIGVVTSTMLHLMPIIDDKKQQNLNTGLCLILFGVGCILGGYLGGKLCDRLRIKLSSTILVYFFCMTCLFCMLASQIMQMWSAIISCFMWGFILYYITANLMVICSRLYGGKLQSFALTKQFHSFAFVIYQIVAICTNNQLPVLYIMAVLFIFGFPAIWGVYKSSEQKQNNQIDRTIDTNKCEKISEQLNNNQCQRQNQYKINTKKNINNTILHKNNNYYYFNNNTIHNLQQNLI